MTISASAHEGLLQFKTVIVSDTHLGKKAASAAFLFEALQNLSCQKLLLNGDIVEGWGLKSKRREPFPEIHARCLDALNAKAANGTDVVWIRGNHDEDLAKKKWGLVNRRVVFRDKGRQHDCPITFCKSYPHTDAQGRAFLVLHGDVFDGFMKSTKKKILAQYADRAYEGVVELNAAFRRAAHNLMGVHVSPAAYLKRKTKKTLGIIESFENAVTSDGITRRFDGVICGHIHHAEISQKKNSLYMNSGDWVESCTALVEDFDGNWRILDWAREREILGLQALPDATQVNPYRAYRGVTERQLAFLRRVWPGVDYSELTEQLRELRHKLGGQQRALAELYAVVPANDHWPNAKAIHQKTNKIEGKIERILAQIQAHP